MFLQQYGRYYYGKRLPIEVSEQVAAVTEGHTVVSFTKVFFVYLPAVASNLALFGHKAINKVEGVTEQEYSRGYKHVSSLKKAQANALASSMKQIPSFVMTALQSMFAQTEKYVYKYEAGGLRTFSLASRSVNKKTGAVSKVDIRMAKFFGFAISAIAIAEARAKKDANAFITGAQEIVAAARKQIQKVNVAVLSVFVSLIRRRAYEVEFTGDFAPGDVISIDSKTMTVTLNGTNALHLIGRDNFPILKPGKSELIYTDAEGTRTVRIRVKWQDRWL